MGNKNKKDIEKQNDWLNNSINDMLNGSDLTQDSNLNDLPSLQQLPPFDFESSNSVNTTNAKLLLDDLLKFYLKNKYINKENYLERKIENETLSFTGLLNQIDMNTHIVQMIVNDLDNGERNFKMYETFCTLQKTHIELLKMKSLFIIHIEESVKKYAADYDYYKKEEGSNNYVEDAIIEDEKNAENQTFKGTRALMQELETDDDFSFEKTEFEKKTEADQNNNQ